MTIPFWCLLVASLLPYLLSFLGGYFRVSQLGRLDNKYPRAQLAQLEGAGARCYGAQQNAWEALPVFASGVLVAHLAGADPARAALLSQVWVAARVVHAGAYLANVDIVRSLAFGVAMACVIGLYVIAA